VAATFGGRAPRERERERGSKRKVDAALTCLPENILRARAMREHDARAELMRRAA